jgi:nucleotide-binding universal stress UspA family protein
MARSILVPLDGSRLAEAALPYATLLARALGASVALLHVLERDAPGRVHGDRHLSGAAEAESYLAAQEAGLRREGLTATHHVHGGPVKRVARSIGAHRSELSCDLAVVCTHGGGGAGRLLLGSVGQRVLAEGRIPVLVVRPGGGPPGIRSILVALDAAHPSPIDLVRELARATGARVSLLMVTATYGTRRGRMRLIGRYLPGATQEAFEQEAEAARAHLARRLAELEAAGLVVAAETVRGAPADEILRAVERLRPDLTVMATHGRRGLDAFWAGSVAGDVCARCDLPVLLVPADPAEARGGAGPATGSGDAVQPR